MINPSKYRWSVLEDTPARLACFGRVFLSKPSIDLARWDFETHGRPAGVSLGRKCGSAGNGIKGVLGRGQMLPAAEHHTAEGNPVCRIARALLIYLGCRTASLLWRRRRRSPRVATPAMRRHSARCTLRSWASARCSRACRTPSSRGSHRLRKVCPPRPSPAVRSFRLADVRA